MYGAIRVQPVEIAQLSLEGRRQIGEEAESLRQDLIEALDEGEVSKIHTTEEARRYQEFLRATKEAMVQYRRGSIGSLAEPTKRGERTRKASAVFNSSRQPRGAKRSK